MKITAVFSILIAVAAACNSTRTASETARRVFKYNDTCDGFPCLYSANCASGVCSNSPNTDAYFNWLIEAEGTVNNTQVEPPMGTCGTVSSGTGAGATIGIIVGVAVVLAAVIGGCLYYRKKRQALQSSLL